MHSSKVDEHALPQSAHSLTPRCAVQAKVASYDNMVQDLQAAKAELAELRLANASLRAEVQAAAHTREHEVRRCF